MNKKGKKWGNYAKKGQILLNYAGRIKPRGQEKDGNLPHGWVTCGSFISTILGNTMSSESTDNSSKSYK